MGDPVKLIKEYRKKGYIIELSVDSARPVYSIYMTATNDVQRLSVPIDKVSFQSLHNAVRGL